MRYLRIHTLDKDWCDKDEVLLHATFQLLIDFIEQEKPNKIVDWNVDELHRKAGKKSNHSITGGKKSVQHGKAHSMIIG